MFLQEDDRLIIQSGKAVSRDSRSGDNQTAHVEERTIFESCTFTIHDDLLKLSCVTYPADAVEITIKVYRRCEKQPVHHCRIGLKGLAKRSFHAGNR